MEGGGGVPTDAAADDSMCGAALAPVGLDGADSDTAAGMADITAADSGATPVK